MRILIEPNYAVGAGDSLALRQSKEVTTSNLGLSGSCMLWGASTDIIDLYIGRYIGRYPTEYRSRYDRVYADISVEYRPMYRPMVHLMILMVSVDISTAILSMVYWSTIGYISVDCRSSLGRHSTEYRSKFGQYLVR